MDALTPKFGRKSLDAWSLDQDSRRPREAEIVSAVEASRILAEGARAIDLRTPDAFNRGHIPGAINRPLECLLEAAGEDVGPVIVYCDAGAESARQAGLLRRIFQAENFFILSHGFEEWREAGLPVARGA